MFGAALEDFSRASAIRQTMVSKVNHLNWPTPKESILKGDDADYPDFPYDHMEVS
jgi:hypothetical protein